MHSLPACVLSVRFNYGCVPTIPRSVWHRPWLLALELKVCTSTSFLIFFPLIFISCRLISLQYHSGFCHTLTGTSHGFTRVPHPEPPSHLPPLLPLSFGYFETLKLSIVRARHSFSHTQPDVTPPFSASLTRLLSSADCDSECRSDVPLHGLPLQLLSDCFTGIRRRLTEGAQGIRRAGFELHSVFFTQRRQLESLRLPFPTCQVGPVFRTLKRDIVI